MSRSSLRPALKAHQHAPAGVAAAAWTPAELTTSLWLDASDASTITESDEEGRVSGWDDKSSNSRHLTQASASLQPSISGSTISVDGTQYLFRTDTWLYAAGSMSLFVVGAGAAQQKRLISEGSSSSANPLYMFETDPGAGASTDEITLHFRNDAGTSFRDPVQISADIAFDGTTKILYWQDTGSAVSGRVDGGAEISTAYTRSGTLTMDRFCVGGLLRASFASGFTGSFKEIITTTLLSTADRQLVEGYLAWKYSLTAGLPGLPGGYTLKYVTFDGVDDTAIAASAWDALPSSAYSVSFWARLPASLTGIEDWDVLIGMHGDTGSGVSHRFKISILANGTLYFAEGDADASSPAHSSLATSAGVIPTDGAWHHWAFTSQGTASGTMTIYLDGSSVASGASGLALDASPRTLNLWVGANPAWEDRRTNCSIDEVTIYSSLLPATGDVSVATLFNNPNGPAAPPATGLINHLRMGDGTGDNSTTIVDQVGNQDLTLANGPTTDDVHPYKNEAPTV